MAEFKVELNHLRVAPRKVRLIADQIRGLPAQRALDLLNFTKKAAALNVSKLIRSGISNADRKGQVDIDQLVVKTIFVDQGPIIRRFQARERGSASRINKKTSHITIVLEEKA